MTSLQVLILMGSPNDAPVMQGAVDVLKELGISVEMTVASAHRSPERVMRLLGEAETRGVSVFIVGAGAAAHLGGVVAAHVTKPVIGVPIDSSALNGLDALLSTVQMPPGVPVATVSIGKPGATNAGVLAAQILALGDKGIAERVEKYKRGLAEKVEEAARKLSGLPIPQSLIPAVKYSIVTFGCRVNQADSFQIEEQLIARRRHRRRRRSDADLVVVNTCSVTSAADQGTRQIVRKIARENPNAQNRRDRLLRHAASRRNRRPARRRADRSQRSQRTDLRASEIGLTTAERFGDGDGACGAEIAPGLAGRTAFTLRVQTGCDQTCCLLHHSVDARSGPQQAAARRACRDRPCERRRLSRDCPHRRASRVVRPRSWRRLVAAASAAGDRAARARHSLPHQLARADGLLGRDRRSRGARRRASRRIFIFRCSTPAIACSWRCGGRIRSRTTAAWSIASATRCRTRRSARDIIVGFPGRDRRRFRRARGVSRGVAADARARVSLFRSARHGGAALPDKVHGSIVRERAQRRSRDRPRAEPAFHRAQDGTVRPGLTIEDGSLVVTDNYLKVRIPPGLPRNEWVTCRDQRSTARRWSARSS